MNLGIVILNWNGIKLLEKLIIKEEVKKRLKPPGIAVRRQGPLHNMRKLKDALGEIN